MNKTSHKVIVGIYLKGDLLDPPRISSLLGVVPTTSRRKGESRLSSTKNEVVAKTGVWAILIEADVSLIDLSDIFDELGQRMGTNSSNLATLPGVTEAYLDIFIAADAAIDGGGTCEFELSEHNLTAAKAFGIPIHFTVAIVKP